MSISNIYIYLGTSIIAVALAITGTMHAYASAQLYSEVQEQGQEILVSMRFTNGTALTSENSELGFSMLAGVLYDENKLRPTAFIDPAGMRYAIDRPTNSTEDTIHAKVNGLTAYGGAFRFTPATIVTGEVQFAMTKICNNGLYQEYDSAVVPLVQGYTNCTVLNILAPIILSGAPGFVGSDVTPQDLGSFVFEAQGDDTAGLSVKTYLVTNLDKNKNYYLSDAIPVTVSASSQTAGTSRTTQSAPAPAPQPTPAPTPTPALQPQPTPTPAPEPTSTPTPQPTPVTPDQTPTPESIPALEEPQQPADQPQPEEQQKTIEKPEQTSKQGVFKRFWAWLLGIFGIGR